MPNPPSVESVLTQCLASDVPLREQLAAVAAADGHEFPQFVPPVEALVARLSSGAVGASAPQVGDTMPPFALPDETGRIVSLDSLLEAGPVAIFFHRGHWCPYCSVTAAALARAQADVEAAGGRMVAILPERQAYAGRLKAQSGAGYPFLSDVDNGYALALGLVFWMGEELSALYRDGGEVISLFQGNEAWMLPIPATFVVGRGGRVVARFVDPDYRRRMAIEDVVAAVAAAT